MTYEIEELKKIRRNIGITQTQLAKRAGVSQSLIAKVESGRSDPSYTKIKKIFNALADLEKKEEIMADQLMTDKIISIDPGSLIKEAIEKMKRFKISQLPVLDNSQLIGLVSESTILDALINSKRKTIREIMQESPPIVSKKTSIKVISSLLKYYPVVLVSEEGKLVGLISKSDLLSQLHGK